MEPYETVRVREWVPARIMSLEEGTPVRITDGWSEHVTTQGTVLEVIGIGEFIRVSDYRGETIQSPFTHMCNVEVPAGDPAAWKQEEIPF